MKVIEVFKVVCGVINYNFKMMNNEFKKKQ